MKKLVVIVMLSLSSSFVSNAGGCIDFASNVSAYFFQDVSTPSGFSFWQNFYLECVERYE